MKIKRIVIFISIIVMLFGMVACTVKDNGESSSQSSSSNSQSSSSSDSSSSSSSSLESSEDESSSSSIVDDSSSSQIGSSSSSSSTGYVEKEPIKYTYLGQKFTDETIKITWINVWNASSESWVIPQNSNGFRILIDGVWRGIDWDIQNIMNKTLKEIKNAGIDVIVFDLTNGFQSWHMNRSVKIAEKCRELGLKFCFAAGNTTTDGINTRAKMTWDDFAGVGAPFEDVYFHKDGKPVFVDYVIESQFKEISSSNLEYIQKFTHVWASGGEAYIDKWGWQLVPSIGSIPSKDSMYVTPSTYWGSDTYEWSHSMAFLDYNLLLASKNQPKHMIIGAYDDAFERNSWMIADTTGAIPERQQNDRYGNLSVDGLYIRVCEWLSEKGPSVVSGGILPDGAYLMRNKNSGLILGTNNLQFVDELEMQQINEADNLGDYIWLYHLGNQKYRVVRMTTGKSLAVVKGDMEIGGPVIQKFDENVKEQIWTISKNADGSYSFKNEACGYMIDVKKASKTNGAFIVLEEKSDSDSQKWLMEPILVME
ncbi:MAG: hypothetical protein E7480_05770 [Ruminococcaceae bacterium]|nr:hypothetical protein [Oscillospiraceae bacterium]